MNNIGTITGTVSWPSTHQWPTGSLNTTPTMPLPSYHNQERHAHAREAMHALLTRMEGTEGYLLKPAEIAEKAWDLSDAMMNEASKRGVYL